MTNRLAIIVLAGVVMLIAAPAGLWSAPLKDRLESSTLSFTSRYEYEGNDLSTDQDFYQYVTFNAAPRELIGGIFSASLYYRLAVDTDGDDGLYGTSGYEPYIEAEDLQQDVGDITHRLYLAYLEWATTDPRFSFRFGRQNVYSYRRFHVDGGRTKFALNEKLSFNAFLGRPVSFYWNIDEEAVLGGGGMELSLRRQHTQFTVDYVGSQEGGFEDDMIVVSGRNNSLGSFRVYASGRFLNGKPFKGIVEPAYRFDLLNLYLKVKYTGVFEEIEDMSFPLSPLAFPVGTLKPYDEFDASGTIEITSNGSLTLGGVSHETTGGDGLYNISYNRYYTYLSFSVMEKNLITLTAEVWDAGRDRTYDAYGSYSHYFGDTQANAGIRYERLRYDYLRERLATDVWVYYAGFTTPVMSKIHFSADFSAEDAQWFTGTNYRVSASLRLTPW